LPATPNRRKQRPVKRRPAVLFGAQYVGFLTDRDVIRVGNEIGKFAKIRLPVIENDIHINEHEGGFARVRITTRDRAITLNEVKVIHVGGLVETIPIHAGVDAGGTYRPIELKGETPIDHIEAKYRSRFFDSSAVGQGSRNRRDFGASTTRVSMSAFPINREL